MHSDLVSVLPLKVNVFICDVICNVSYMVSVSLCFQFVILGHRTVRLSPVLYLSPDPMVPWESFSFMSVSKESFSLFFVH